MTTAHQNPWMTADGTRTDDGTKCTLLARAILDAGGERDGAR